MSIAEAIATITLALFTRAHSNDINVPGGPAVTRRSSRAPTPAGPLPRRKKTGIRLAMTSTPRAAHGKGRRAYLDGLTVQVGQSEPIFLFIQILLLFFLLCYSLLSSCPK